MRTLLSLLLFCCLLSTCSVSRKIHQSAQKIVLQDSALLTAHVGISIYEPATGKWWYNWQGDKYFVPASNTKIATCYAAMKYLGDSLVGARLAVGKDNMVEIFPSGDPTFLNQEFKRQPLFDILKTEKVLRWDLTGWKSERWGSGWSWNDYDAAYMVERSPFPIFANLMRLSLQDKTFRTIPAPTKIWTTLPDSVGFDQEKGTVRSSSFSIERKLDANEITLRKTVVPFSGQSIPIRTDVRYMSKILQDTLHAENVSTFTIASGYKQKAGKTTIHSQPTDSLLKPMMHRSDNFFAEQALLMVSNEVLGYMSDEKIIDTLLKTDFKNLSHRPRWADGSGLSRYNLFTPQNFVAILQKIKAEFGMDRIQTIFASGGEGTLSNFFKAEKPFLYAKTGTLSGVVALSGYLTTAQGKELIVSVLVNNHRSGAVLVRRTVEKFLQNIRDQY